MSANINIFNIEPIILWIGIWGLVDTIINKYIDYDNHNARIILYVIIIMMAYIIYHLRTNNKLLYNKIHDESKM